MGVLYFLYPILLYSYDYSSSYTATDLLFAWLMGRLYRLDSNCSSSTDVEITVACCDVDFINCLLLLALYPSVIQAVTVLLLLLFLYASGWVVRPPSDDSSSLLRLFGFGDSSTAVLLLEATLIVIGVGHEGHSAVGLNTKGIV